MLSQFLLFKISVCFFRHPSDIGQLFEILKNIDARTTAALDLHAVGTGTAGHCIIASWTPEVELLTSHVLQHGPVVAAGPAAAVEPVLLAQPVLSGGLRSGEKYWAIVFKDFFSLPYFLDCLNMNSFS